jgi:hypothetical protein
MSAFQAYAGAYEFRGESYRWRCYATTRVHAVRHSDHRPLPKAPPGRKWLKQSPLHHEPNVAWLVDEGVEDFSHILLQMVAEPGSAPVRTERLAAAV